MPPPTLSIIIPAYNEEKRIAAPLADYLSFFRKKYKQRFELIVVLNGCKDNTLRVVRSFRRYKQLRIINIPEAIGKGGALIRGFHHAQGTVIGFADADGSTRAQEFYRLLQKMDNYDVILASRWISGAIVEPQQQFIRRIASRTFNIIVRSCFGISVRDTQCGCKIFRQSILKKILGKLGTTNWAFDIDLLYLLKKNHAKIAEIPTVWQDTPGSRLHIGRASLEMFAALVRLRLLYSILSFTINIYDTIIISARKFIALSQR